MSEKMSVDVAIMGSGVAGMGAAYRLTQAGDFKIAIFEKYPAQGGAVSNCPMCFCSTPDTPEAQASAYEVIARTSNYTANMGLVSKAIKQTAEFPDLILNQLKIEAPMVVNRDPADYGNQRGYTMGHSNGLDVGDIYFLQGRGSQGHAFSMAMLRLRLLLEKKGVEFYFSTPIKKIIRDSASGKVTGAIAGPRDGDGEDFEIECKALIVAAGGITGNLDMMKEEGLLNTKFVDDYKDGGQVNITFQDSCQDGDGQREVWEIGGKKAEIAISADPQVPNPGVGVGPNIRWIAANQVKIITEQPYLRVNELGKRFINEDMSNDHTAISVAIIDHCQNNAAYMIFDEDTAKALGEKVEDGYIYFIFQGMRIENIAGQMDAAIAQGNKHMCHFPTIHEVCEYMGIDEKGLKKTIEKYNKAAEIGYDEDFHTNPIHIKPVHEESGQIYCFRMLAGGYDSLGGLQIDDNANVVDEYNMPIEGLYAGGDICVGSLYGSPQNIGGTVYGSMSTGMVAGVSAAAYLKGEM